jgi:hypothetical protein
MKINLEFAELHTPLFLGGKNFGNKLNANSRTAITLIYDQTEKELWVAYAGKGAIIPTSNVVSMTPGTPDNQTVSIGDRKQEQVGKTGKFNANPSAKAQVSSPTHHVFDEPPKAA